MTALKDSVIIDPKREGRPSFFRFDVFITPLILQIAFLVACVLWAWLGAAICVSTWRGGSEDQVRDMIVKSMGPFGYVVGIVITIVGIVTTRVFCEFNIVIFKIFQELRRSK